MAPGRKRKRTLSTTYKEKYYLLTFNWKEAKKNKAKAALLGHLVIGSFQELSSTPAEFSEAAKARAIAFLEYYFLEEAGGQSYGEGPSKHLLEYHHRVKVSLDHEILIKREAYRRADYRFAFLMAGAPKGTTKCDPPVWAPTALLLQMRSMGPKIRTVPLMSAVLHAFAVSV